MNKLWFSFPFLLYVVSVDDDYKTYVNQGNDSGHKKESQESDNQESDVDQENDTWKLMISKIMMA